MSGRDCKVSLCAGGGNYSFVANVLISYHTYSE